MTPPGYGDNPITSRESKGRGYWAVECTSFTLAHPRPDFARRPLLGRLIAGHRHQEFAARIASTH
jgi:hypothetical protein